MTEDYHELELYERVFIPDTCEEIIEELHEDFMEYGAKDNTFQQEENDYLFEKILLYIDRLREMVKREEN